MDERGYVITSRHIIDAIFSVDVWLPEGRLVGGTVRFRGPETGLVLIELKRADLLDLKPIELEPLARSTGPGEGIIVVSLAAGEVTATETRREVGYGISDLAGNEWFRLNSKHPMASVGGPVLSEQFGQVIGIMVFKEIAGEVDNFVLKLDSLERQIQSLVPAEDSAMSAPASTAVPMESAAISEGWIYITQDCLEGWTNCEYPTLYLGRSDVIRVTASKFAEGNDATGELPYLEFHCRENGDLFAQFSTGDLDFFNENDSGIRIGVWIEGVQRDLVPVNSFQYPLSIASIDGHRIARPFYEAELTESLIEVGSLSFAGRAIGVFDPVGFRTNYWRLPCAR